MSNTLTFVKKGVSIAVTSTTILWSVGLGALAPLATRAATPGQLIKGPTSSTVYYLGSDSKRYVFPNPTTYFSWYSDFSGVVGVSQSELESYRLAGNVTVRPGTKLVKISTDPKTYAVEPGGKLRWVQTEAIATTLWGATVWQRVVVVPDYFFKDYKLADDYSPLTTNVYPSGSLIKSAASSDIYYVDGSSKRKVSASGLTGNQLNAANVVVAPDSVFNALSAGSDITGQESAIWNVSGGASATPVSTGSGLTVAVAADTPAAGVQAFTTAYNPAVKLTLTASADGSVTVTGLTLTRLGITADADIAGVGVFDAAGVRHGNVVTLASTKAAVDFTSEPITVPAGQSTSVMVKTNLGATPASGSGTYQLAVLAASDVKTTATVSGTFPLNGNGFSLIAPGTSVGGLTIDAVQLHNNGPTDGTAVTVNIGTTDQDTGKFRFVANANEDAVVKKIRIYNNGSAADEDIADVDLIGPDGAVLKTVAKPTNKAVTFDLSDRAGGGFVMQKGTTKDFTVRENVLSGATRTIRWLIQNDYDVEAYGKDTGSGLLPTAAATVDCAFPIGDPAVATGACPSPTTTNNINRITVGSGTLTLSRANSSPTGDIAQGGNAVVIGEYEVKATGENMEIRQIQYNITRSAAVAFGGTFRVQVKNGPVIYSISGASATYGAATTATPSQFYTLTANQTVVLQAVADILSTATNAMTYSVALDITQVKRINTNDITDPTVAAVASNTMTVRAGSLSVSANTSQTPINVVAGQSDLVTLSSWNFTAGSAEGVSISSVQVGSNVAGFGRDFKDLELWIGGVKVSQDTSTTIAPTATTATITFNVTPAVTIPAAQSKLVELKGRMLTTTTDGAVTPNIQASGVTGSGATSQQSLTTTPAVNTNGQAVTINTAGTLTIARDTVTNVKSSQVVAGTTGVVLGAFKLTVGDVEPIQIKKVVLRNVGTNTDALANIGLYDGSSTTPINSVTKSSLGTEPTTIGNDSKSVQFDYSASPLVIAKNTFKVITAKADTAYAATSGTNIQVSLEVVDALGTGSNARIYPTQTTELASVAATNAYAAGEVIAYSSTAGVTEPTNRGFSPVTTAVAAAATLLGAGVPAAGITLAATSRVTKLAPVSLNSTRVSEAPSAASTNAYAAGDVLALNDVSTVANNNLHVVTTAVAAGATLLGAGAPIAGITLATGDRITRVHSGFSQTTIASATVPYNLGDILAVTDADTPANNGLYTVTNAFSVGGDLTAAATVASQVVQLQDGSALVTGDRVAKMPTTSTEVPSAAATYAYSVGDVVVIDDDSTPANNGVYVVTTAVAAGATLLGAGAPVSGITLTASDRISKLYTVAAEDNLKRVYPTKFNFAWTAASGGAVLSTGNQIEVGRFTMGADASNTNNPSATVSVTGLNFTQLASARLTNFVLNDVTSSTDVTVVNGGLTANSSNFQNTTAGGTLSITAFQQGETRTYKILADVGTNGGSQSVQFRFNAGTHITAGTASWSVSNPTAVTSTWTVLASNVADTTSAQMTASATGSDVAAPTISSIAITDGTNGNDILNIGDTIAITFSEKIDPVTVNAGLVYGGTTVAITDATTGDIAVADNAGGTNACGVASANDTINVVNIACISLGNGTAATSAKTGAVTAGLNAAGTILTLTVSTATGALDAADGTEADGGEILTTIRDTAGNLLGASAWTIAAVDI